MIESVFASADIVEVCLSHVISSSVKSPGCYEGFAKQLRRALQDQRCLRPSHASLRSVVVGVVVVAVVAVVAYSLHDATL